MRLNLMSCFHVLKPTVKVMMKSGGGSIAFCTSAGMLFQSTVLQHT